MCSKGGLTEIDQCASRGWRVAQFAAVTSDRIAARELAHRRPGAGRLQPERRDHHLHRRHRRCLLHKRRVQPGRPGPRRQSLGSVQMQWFGADGSGNSNNGTSADDQSISFAGAAFGLTLSGLDRSVWPWRPRAATARAVTTTPSPSALPVPIPEVTAARASSPTPSPTAIQAQPVAPSRPGATAPAASCCRVSAAAAATPAVR